MEDHSFGLGDRGRYPAKRMNRMDKLLIKLLESLLLAQKKGADVGSTDVREEMFSVIWQGFLKPTSPLSMPRKFYFEQQIHEDCLLYTSPSPRDKRQSRMPSSA